MMAAECAVAAGDLRAARALAEGLRDLPFYREEGHLATARLIVVGRAGGRLGRGGRRWPSGSARDGSGPDGRARATSAAARTRPRPSTGCAGTTTPGRRGWTSWTPWRRRAARCRRSTSASSSTPCCCCTAACPSRRAQLLDTPPEQFRDWYNGMWRPWYAALWAEAAVLSGHEDAAAPHSTAHAW